MDFYLVTKKTEIVTFVEKWITLILSYLKSLDFNFYIDVYVGGGCGYRT